LNENRQESSPEAAVLTLKAQSQCGTQKISFRAIERCPSPGTE